MPAFQDGQVGFFGFARPAFGSIPPTVEMQSRMFAMVINGSLTLPCPDDMEKIAKKDQANWEWRFGYDAKRVKGLVDFQLYCDELAAEIGALPPLTHLFFTKPMIWWKIMFSSFTMHQYRLVGPYANPEAVAPVYEKVRRRPARRVAPWLSPGGLGRGRSRGTGCRLRGRAGALQEHDGASHERSLRATVNCAPPPSPPLPTPSPRRAVAER